MALLDAKFSAPGPKGMLISHSPVLHVSAAALQPWRVSIEATSCGVEAVTYKSEQQLTQSDLCFACEVAQREAVHFEHPWEQGLENAGHEVRQER